MLAARTAGATVEDGLNVFDSRFRLKSISPSGNPNTSLPANVFSFQKRRDILNDPIEPSLSQAMFRIEQSGIGRVPAAIKQPDDFDFAPLCHWKSCGKDHFIGKKDPTLTVCVDETGFSFVPRLHTGYRALRRYRTESCLCCRHRKSTPLKHRARHEVAAGVGESRDRLRRRATDVFP